MSRFRRRGRDDESGPADPDAAQEHASLVDGDGDVDRDDEGGGDEARRDGPWDESEVDDPAAGGRVDLGGLWLPGRKGLEVRIEADEGTGAVIAVNLVIAGSALQVQPFAAPRSEGIWADVRQEIKAGITQQGGTADEVQGPLGPELRTKVQTRGAQGASTAQAARFVGVDGPRWFLRGLLTGPAALQDEAAAPLLALFQDVVVVRGADAMAPREPIPMRMPSQLTEAVGDATSPDEDPLKPFERGPEITEIH